MGPVMRALAIGAVAAAVVLAGATRALPGADGPAGTAVQREGLLRLPRATPAGDVTFYGHIASLTRRGRLFELRFDPAWLLRGETARRAAVADGALPPGEPVPNDSYTRDESHKLLTFDVPPTTHATVVTTAGTRGLGTTAVSVGELAQIVRGRNPRHRPLFVPGNGLGFWIRVSVDTVKSLDQQYHP
jgi:hypothetical protein